MRWASFALVAAIVGGAAGAAWAQSDFDVTDKNDDGNINRHEFMERQVEIFYLNDIDRNGGLVIEEMEGVDAARFAAADKDGDGALSMTEFLEARSVDFDAADKSDEGVLSPAEIEGAE